MMSAVITVRARATKVCGATCGKGGAIKEKYRTPQKRKDAPRQNKAIRSKTLVAVVFLLASLQVGVCGIMRDLLV
jgi:hypothetical protein